MSTLDKEIAETLPRWNIPPSWDWVSLADVGNVITGNTPSTKISANYGNAIPFVKPPELLDKGIRSAPDGLSEKGLKKARSLPIGAVLVSCIGGLGKTGITKVPLAFNQQINAIVFNENVVPEYGFYYVQTLKEWLHSVASATTLPIVNKRKFQRAPIPIAPLNEQKLIVAEIEKQFSRLDEAVAALKRIQANLRLYKASVLKAAVEGKLTEQWRREHPDVEPASQLLKRILTERRKKWEETNLGKKYKEPVAPDTSNLPELPKGWVWARLDFICEKIQDGSHFSPKVQYTEPAKNRYLYITAKNIKERGIDLSEVTFIDEAWHKSIFMRCNPEKEDILLIKDGVKTGIAAVNNIEEEFSLLSSVALFKPIREILNSWYLKYFLNSPSGFKMISKQMTGTAIKRIILDKIRLSYIPLPPISEQKQIVKEIENCLSINEEIETAIKINLKRAERLRQSILKKAFRGTLLRA